MTGQRAGHTPRFPGYTADLKTSAFVFAQYGCQAPTRAEAAAAAAHLRTLFTAPEGPVLVDRGSFVDDTGQHNVVWLAYWQEPATHDRWRDSDQVRAIWHGLDVQGPVGYWREESVIPADRIETIHSHRAQDYPMAGLAQVTDLKETTTHDYWGAARDRIRATATENLTPELPVFRPAQAETRGRRVAVKVPGNVALIRTAQDWSASTVFREFYLREVKPIKDRGVHYLAHTPESGCITTRNLDEEAADGTPLNRTCTIGWFASLEHLLTWCKSHQTHLDIYGSFFRMVSSAEAPLDVAFWHELSVLPGGAVSAEYVNCHPTTGFLPLVDRHTATASARTGLAQGSAQRS